MDEALRDKNLNFQVPESVMMCSVQSKPGFCVIYDLWLVHEQGGNSSIKKGDNSRRTFLHAKCVYKELQSCMRQNFYIDIVNNAHKPRNQPCAHRRLFIMDRPLISKILPEIRK